MPSYPELNKLRAVSFTFDAQSLDKKIEYLLLANRNMIEHPEFVKQYSELLLFHLEYPQNKKVFMLAIHGVVCITNVLRSNKQLCGKLKDTCLPYTSFTTKYTHDLISWLNQQPECALCIDSFGDNKVSLYHWLGACINKFGKNHLAVATLPEDSLMQLEPRKERQLSFLLREVARLDNQPEVKDLLWSNLKIWISITSKAKDFSLLFNRIEKSKTFYNSVLLKTFDYQQLYEAPLPPASKLTNAKALDLQKVIRYSLTLTFRETDPATYFDIRSLQYFKFHYLKMVILFRMVVRGYLAIMRASE
ncbi:MAG: hypothetical protein IPO27_02345 [Bacteroidetes bacterium]|nr:hypothetical protein [Bacteroidota bacterium]